MVQYFVSVDRRLYQYDNGEFTKVDTELRFNPSHEISVRYALTIEGQIYDIAENRILDIPYVITSFVAFGDLCYAVTEDRLLIRIGRRERNNQRRINIGDISIVAREIDYILHAAINGVVVIQDNNWLSIILSPSEDLIELDPDRPVIDRPDRLNRGNRGQPFQVEIMHIREDMPSLEEIIIIHNHLVTTYRGVYSTTNMELILDRDDIVDAVIMLPNNPDRDRIIMIIDNKGDIAMIKEGNIETSRSRLLDDLTDRSPWYGFINITDRANYGYSRGIHNRNGDTYLINEDWMIRDIDVPPEFYLGSASNRKKNPRTRI